MFDSENPWKSYSSPINDAEILYNVGAPKRYKFKSVYKPPKKYS